MCHNSEIDLRRMIAIADFEMKGEEMIELKMTKARQTRRTVVYVNEADIYITQLYITKEGLKKAFEEYPEEITVTIIPE